MVSCHIELWANDITGVFAYPNPVEDILYVNGVDENAKIEIYNLTGIMVLKETGNQIEVNSLNSGIYILKVQVDNNTKTLMFSIK